MKLGEIVSSKSGGAFRAPTKPVKFKVLGQNNRGEQIIADAEAVLVLVPEEEREAALIDSEKAMRKQFPDGIVSPDRLLDSHAYHTLAIALRDTDDAAALFAPNVPALKGALHKNVARALYEQYLEFCNDEFPEVVDDETFAAMIEDAKKKSLPDLLSQYGSSTMKRAWGSLVAHFGTSPTPTSGDGELG